MEISVQQMSDTICSSDLAVHIASVPCKTSKKFGVLQQCANTHSQQSDDGEAVRKMKMMKRQVNRVERMIEISPSTLMQPRPKSDLQV